MTSDLARGPQATQHRRKKGHAVNKTCARARILGNICAKRASRGGKVLGPELHGEIADIRAKRLFCHFAGEGGR